MSKISTYTTVAPTASDKLIGTDVAGTVTDATKNFTAGSVAALAKKAGVLSLPAHADNATASGAGLAAGDLYQTDGTGAAPLNAAGIVMVVQ
ncbi:MAG: hypothetical protein CML17_09130 [Pusillimonas sp.]|nr:hypothetical protein [Pusillimonas sp.]